MRKGASIFLLLCFGFTVLSGLGMITHELLHATSSFTGIHQHDVELDDKKHGQTSMATTAHSHNHHHNQPSHSHQRHSIIDHAKLFQEIMAFSQNYKSVFNQILFFPFYYVESNGFPELNFTIVEEENQYLYHTEVLNRASTPPTPPPELV